jgi:hypothetical protein
VPEACRRLALTPWWRRWLDKRTAACRNGSGARARWDALRKAYENTDPNLRRVGEGAYRLTKIDPDARERWAIRVMVYLNTGPL